MIPRRPGQPTLLIHDGSPGLGGSITSVGALAPFLGRAGWRVEVAAFQPDGWAQERIAPHLLPGQGDRITGAGYFAREVLRARDLARLCRQLRPDVLLANNGPAANLSTHLAGWTLHLPVLQYVRGPFWESEVSARALRAAAGVFTVGDECSRQVVKVSGVAPEQVEEGLDPSRWPTMRRAGARGFLWNSSLVAWKGLPLLLEAYGSMGVPSPGLEVCYAPFPPGHPEAIVPPSKLPAGVTAHPAPPDLDAIRARSLVYLHTAQRPEPFGRSLLEAMAAGLCPIVPEAGTPGRLVRNGENGLTYSPGSLEGLRRAMRIAASDPELCERLGARAEAEARAYRSELVFQPILQALERLHPARTVPDLPGPLEVAHGR